MNNKWSFWYIKNDRLKDWKDNLIKIIDFEYVEDFWSIFNYLVSPSVLETGTDLALFKAGIEPMWEGKGDEILKIIFNSKNDFIFKTRKINVAVDGSSHSRQIRVNLTN